MTAGARTRRRSSPREASAAGYVGPDDRGLELEVIAVELASGDCSWFTQCRARYKDMAEMAKRATPKVTTKTPIGRDVDLTGEVRRDKQGQRVDEAYVERLIGAGRKPGRPRLADGGPSPSIAFRPPAALRDQAEEVASREGKTVSELAREALEARIAACDDAQAMPFHNAG